MSFDQTEESIDNTSDPAQAMHSGQDGSELDLDPAFGDGSAKPSKRNAIILGVLAVVAAFAIWFMYFRGSPSSAQAELAQNNTGAQIKEFLDSGNINLMKQTLKDTEKVVQQFRAYPGQTQVPLASLRSNPFRELAPKADAPVVARQDDGEEAREHAKVVTAVTELHLQSVVRGGKYRGCMINNTLYQEGQQIGIFTVKHIATGTVEVENGKYRFELKMQNP